MVVKLEKDIAVLHSRGPDTNFVLKFENVFTW